ncbi:PQQ-binding-like beta-propeller repeat protein [Streptomyces sp. NPDC003035]|uniref:protein kinase domain-containing protein n=1 Tax=Streptomyces sp. NPDC003035 TaxID=3364676 RepID=UPI00369191D5
MNPLGLGDPLRVGPYRVLGVLGEGGMGRVYVASGPDGRPAAVKVLRPELAHDYHLAQRFVREAHTAQAVTSRRVARVLGAEMEAGRPWIATEFLAGPTLDQAVGRYGPFDEPTVRALAAALSEALRDIHAAGLVHRDVKPANIVLTSDGPRVIDFGIARPEHGLTLTTTGQIPVTPGYGAPEQVLGKRVTGAADVFSLGAVLVYAATGRRAYNGPHVAAVQYAVVHEEPDLSGLPESTRVLVAPLLAKDPRFRPTPEQIARAFAPDKKARDVWRQSPLHQEVKRREAEIRRQTAAAPTTVVQRAPSRRRFLTAWGAGGALLLAGGGGGTAWWLKERAATELPPAGDAPDAPLLAQASEGIRPSPLWGPVEAAASGPLPPPIVLRDVVIFAARDGGLTALKVTDGSRKWTLPRLSARARQLALDEDRFVAADASGALLCFNASTSAQEWSAPDADVAFLLAAEADAVYVLTTKGKLRAVGTADRTTRWTVTSTESSADITGPLAAVGGNRLVLSGTDGTVRVLDTKSGKELWHITGQATTALQPVIEKGVVYMGGRTLTALTLDGRQLWAVPSRTKPQGTQGGWGPPVVDADGVTAADGVIVTRYGKDGGRGDYWWADLNGGMPPLTPPVVQGNCLWVVEGGYDDFGVSGFSKPSRKRVWTYERDDRGPWSMTGAGNRVFLISQGKVVAMPVF